MSATMQIESNTSYFNVIANAIKDPYLFYSQDDKRGYLNCLSDEALSMLCEDFTDGYMDSDDRADIIDRILQELNS